MKLYKVLIRTGEQVRSFYFDYTPYLPRDGQPGPWLPVDAWYVTTDPREHGLPGDVVFEVEATHTWQPFGLPSDQYLAERIRLVREVKPLSADRIEAAIDAEKNGSAELACELRGEAA